MASPCRARDGPCAGLCGGVRMMSTPAAGRSVYLDMQATTPVDPRVLDAMLPTYTEAYGNPHSRTHHYGWETQDLVEDARAGNPPPPRVVVDNRNFRRGLASHYIASWPQPTTASGTPYWRRCQRDSCSLRGATELNNAAIKGVARFYGEKRRHIITTVTVRLMLPFSRNATQQASLTASGCVYMGGGTGTQVCVGFLPGAGGERGV